MQIILISHLLAKAKTLTLSLRHVAVSVTLALGLLAGMTAALYWLSLRFAAELKWPVIQQLAVAAQKGETESRRFVHVMIEMDVPRTPPVPVLEPVPDVRSEVADQEIQHQITEELRD